MELGPHRLRITFMKNLMIIILFIFTNSVFAKAKASDEAIEKQKKLCAAKGKKYWKSKNSCKKSDSKKKENA